MAMSRATSGHPRVPHTTPASLRPPIQNPFEKLTAPEFDAFIGDITGRLRRALGREEPLSSISHPSEVQKLPAPGDLSVDDDEAANDSFAEVKARRAAKGKERAIDYEEEDEEEEFSVEFGSGEEYAEEEGEDEQEAESSMAQWNRLNEYDDDEADSDEDSDDIEQPVNGHDEVIEILSDSDEEEAAAPVRIGPPNASQRQVYRGEAEEEEDYEEDELRSSPPAPGISEHDIGYRIQRAEADEEEFDEGEIDEDTTQEADVPDVDIPNPWKGSETYAEDYYSGGDVLPNPSQVNNAHILQGEYDEEEFPPRNQDTRDDDVDISDPWEGPRTFAEDFYSGGELRDDPSILTPSHITPRLTPQSQGQKSQEPEIISIDDSDDEEVEERRSGTRSPVREEDFDESSINDLYAELDEDDGNVKAATSSVRNASPPHMPHERAAEPPVAAPTGHVDWNYPPAFPGKVASKSGHIKTPEEPVANSDLIEPGHELELEHQHQEVEEDDEDELKQQEPEILEISDDEEDDVGPAPLSTSDLVIPDDHDEGEAAEDDGTDQLGNDDLYVDPTDVVTTAASENALPEVETTQADDESIYAELEMLFPLDVDYSHSQVDYDVMHFLDGMVARHNALQENDKSFEEQVISTTQDMLQVQSQHVDGIGNQAEAGAQNLLTESTATTEVLGEDISNVAERSDAPAMTLVEESDVPSLEKSVPVEPAVEYADASMDPEASVSEEHGTFTMPEDLPKEDDAVYFVTEIGETIIIDPTLGADDAVTVGSEFVASPADFSVEEPITEGRRTEEPDFIVTSITATPAPESAPSTESADAISAIQEIASEDSGLRYVLADAESEDERPRRRRPHLVHTPRSSRTNVAGPSTRTTDHSEAQPVVTTAVVTEGTNTSVPVVTVSAEDDVPSETHTELPQSSPRGTLASGIPLPVFADPTVRDPTSIGGSPGTTSPSFIEAGSGELDNVASLRDRLTATLIKKRTGHSPSGLFTPLTDGDGSSSVSNSQPESREDNQIKDVNTKPTRVETEQGDAAPSTDDVKVPATDTKEITPKFPKKKAQELHIDTGIVTPAHEHAHHDDEDADGDVDPDYVEYLVSLSDSESDASPVQDASEVEATLTNQVDDNASESSALTPVDATVDYSLQRSSPLPSSPAHEDDKQVSSPKQGSRSPVDTTTGPEQTRPLKRKRRSPPSGPPRETRSMRSKNSHEPGPEREPGSSKSKGKERAQDIADDKSIASSAEDNLGSPIELTRGEPAISRATSRASSVVSNILDSSSVISQPSPTVDRSRWATLIRPFIQANGFLHHTHGRVAATLTQQQRPRPPSSRASSSQSGPAEAAREEPSTSTAPAPTTASDPTTAAHVPSPAPAPVPTPSIQTSSSAPVTRSNCKYRKISLPLAEGRPHVYFIVPGCSLSNASLMQEENIQDHGDALAETSEQAVGPVETLGFSSNLIAILRRLVGVDLLRMNEIFYLPTLNDGFKRRRHRNRFSIDGRAMPNLSASAVKRLGGSSQHSPATKAPVSQAESISTVASSRKQGSQASKRSTSLSLSASISDNEETDLEEPRPKKRPRARRSKKKVKDAPAETENGQPSTSTAVNDEEKAKPRRSTRRLHTDAAAYKPTEEEHESSEDEGTTKRGKGKGKITGRKKRGRPAEQGEDAERPAATAKRRKVAGKSTPAPSGPS